jgi:hypothetical protein
MAIASQDARKPATTKGTIVLAFGERAVLCATMAAIPVCCDHENGESKDNKSRAAVKTGRQGKELRLHINSSARNYRVRQSQQEGTIL